LGRKYFIFCIFLVFGVTQNKIASLVLKNYFNFQIL